MAEVLEEQLTDVKLIRLDSFSDGRGFFSEIYRKNLYEEMGIYCDFVQMNHSYSIKKTIRGMHFQSSPGQAKLITVFVGCIYDVFVDIRPHSPNFGKWKAYELHAKAQEQLFIPVGFAHGFAVLSEYAHIIYSVDSIYNPKNEKRFFYADPEVGIEWPFEDPILSPSDDQAPFFKEVLQ